jgi:hypothetical protein
MATRKRHEIKRLAEVSIAVAAALSQWLLVLEEHFNYVDTKSGATIVAALVTILGLSLTACMGGSKQPR